MADSPTQPPTIEVGYDEPDAPTTPPTIRLEDIFGQLPMVTGTPTYTPKTFRDSLALDNTTGIIYYYDFTNNVWKTVRDTNLLTSFNTRTGAIVLGNADVLAASDTIQTYTPSASSTATLNLALGNVHHITMPAGNITIAISNATPGQIFLIRILQDGTGSRTVTWFTTIKWAGGSAPTLTATASKADTIVFEVTGTNTYDGTPAMQNL